MKEYIAIFQRDTEKALNELFSTPFLANRFDLAGGIARSKDFATKALMYAGANGDKEAIATIEYALRQSVEKVNSKVAKKVRREWFKTVREFIVELKTTRDASKKKVLSRRLHVQNQIVENYNIAVSIVGLISPKADLVFLDLNEMMADLDRTVVKRATQDVVWKE